MSSACIVSNAPSLCTKICGSAMIRFQPLCFRTLTANSWKSLGETRRPYRALTSRHNWPGRWRLGGGSTSTTSSSGSLAWRNA
eukprot:13646293-Heterocapsa_arctica.AAC.1